MAPDRHFPTFAAFAMADRDHALSEAYVLDPDLHQLRRAGAGLQQSLQHQPGPAVLGIGLVKGTQLLLNCEPIHAPAVLGKDGSVARCTKPEALEAKQLPQGAFAPSAAPAAPHAQDGRDCNNGRAEQDEEYRKNINTR